MRMHPRLVERNFKNMLFHKTKIITAAILLQSKFLILASLLSPLALYYKYFKTRGRLWLIGENEGRCLYDNGYVFYRFCREKHSDNKIFFAASKQSINNDAFLKKDLNTVYFGGLKHILLFLLADTLIYSHAQSDVGYIQLIKIFKRNCKRVFLQHGIIAFKQIHDTYRKKHNEMDIFIVSSDFEKKIVLKNFDFDEDTLKITGLARYDTLLTNRFTAENSILYMPTWRSWAFSEKNAKNYISGIESLLTNKYLIYLLEKYEIKFNFFIHNNMSCYLKNIKYFPGISIISSPKKHLQDVLKENSLLITDYSSVAWDFYYLGKPVLFYQFDQEEYLSKKGSYIDFNSKLFGELFTECDQLVNSIEKYIHHNFVENPKYAKNRNQYFKYRDTNNCQRIFNTISPS